MSEIRVLKQVPHQPLGQEVLDEHLVYHVLRQGRIQGLPAEGYEISKGYFEARIFLVRFGDVFGKRVRKIWNAAFKLLHCTLKFALI